MNYKTKLLDPRWQKKRLKIFERDKFTCQECKETEKTLHVHHEYYLPDIEPWDYPDEAFKTLCVDCHQIKKWLTDRLVLTFSDCETKFEDFKLYHRKMFILKFLDEFDQTRPKEFIYKKHFESIFDGLLKYLDFELVDKKDGRSRLDKVT